MGGFEAFTEYLDLVDEPPSPEQYVVSGVFLRVALLNQPFKLGHLLSTCWCRDHQVNENQQVICGFT
jgi:hypothetical protein